MAGLCQRHTNWARLFTQQQYSSSSLKPSNILVCNQHLKAVAHDETAMGKAYEQCPIVCRLTDFDLISRGVDMQTKSVAMSKTTSINYGTPAW